MHAYQISPGSDIDSLARVELAPAPLGPHEVRIRVHAVALNYRDLMVARGDYLVSAGTPIIPCSDAAGDIIEVGSKVMRFRVGDRVAGSFFPSWLDGEPTPATTADAPGAASDGVLAEVLVRHEDSVVAVPPHLDFIEASTLPCAAVTAWNALFEEGRLQPGSTVLLLGTGGVSISALQLAKAAGLRTLITSSSDAKLERARSLGADATINYRQTPDWEVEVERLTQGRGVDLVVEVGGQGTLPRSIASARMGGRIALIGGVSGFGASDIQPLHIIGSARRISGIFVGSRGMFERLNQFVGKSALRPVIDQVFPFDQAPQAFAHLRSAQHFGKVVIQVR